MTAVVVGAPLTTAQDDAVPPRVIDVWPLPGVELAADQPLTVTFDQPMDQESVETAFALDPPLPGAFSWVDARTMRFLPDAEWPRNTTFAATLGADAAAESGAALETPFTFDVATVGPLLVASVSPEPAAQDVDADARVVVTFDRPVVPLVSTGDQAVLPSPITIEPSIVGDGEWINTSMYAFTPDTAMQGSTTYTVTVTSGLEGADGALLDQTYQWTFRTAPPQVQDVTPGLNATDILLEQPVTITFTQPMDRTSAENAFALLNAGLPVEGSFSWNDDSTAVTFTPSEPLAMETTYTLNLEPFAVSANGQATLDDGLSQAFTTLPYPHVENTYPRNGDANVAAYYMNPQITFSSPMNWNTLEGKIVISPEPDTWLPETYEWDPHTLNLRFSARASTTYTITILAGAEDIYGNAIPTDYTFTFTTGAIEPDAYPIINGSFMLTSADREDTRLAMLTSGVGSYSVSVYRLSLEAIDDMVPWSYNDWYFPPTEDTPYTFSAILPPWATQDNLIRSVTQQFDTNGEVRVPQEVLLASDSGGQLPMGLYWVVVNTSTPSQMMGQTDYQFALAVVNTSITVKRGPEETLVWLTDLVTAAPVAGSTVSIMRNDEVLAAGTTDADGVFRAPIDLPQDDADVYIVAEGENVYGAWYSNQEAELPRERGYLYTDRPIYRPGETVYYRGVLRQRHDMDYAVPDLNTVHVTIKNQWDDTVYLETDLSLSDFGSFSGEFAIPEDAELGDMAIVADYGDATYYAYGGYNAMWQGDGTSRVVFTVAEFRVPEYEVTVTAQDEAILQGEPANLLAEARYYAGGGVSNATVSYSVFGSSVPFDYEGQGNYAFYDDTLPSFNYEPLGSGEATTDDAGQLLLPLETTAGPQPLPMVIMAEATVTDESGQPISARTEMMAHPANLYVGLGTSQSFGDAGESLDVEIITVTPDSVPVAGQSVELEVVEERWTRIPIEGQFGRYRWAMETSPVATDRVVTDSDGLARYTFVPPDSGTYRIRAVVRDEQERQNSSVIRFYIQGESMVFWGEPGDSIELRADKTSYKPGETSRILVPLPYTGHTTVLLTTERAGVIEHDVVEVDGTTLIYDLPITEAHVPTVYVSVAAVHGIDEETPNPDIRLGTITLAVEPVEQRLTIEAVPSSESNAPRSTVSFDLKARDAEGNPVQAEIGVSLTDEAVLSLMEPNSTTLERAFYGQQNNYVYTTSGISALIDRLTDAAFPGGRGGGGGGGGMNVLIRENFVYTPLWAPHVVTDENGEATVSVELPDNLTTWRLDARAVTAETEVGQAEEQIVSTLPLIVRPVAPRFFVVGDRVQLAAIINNNTDAEQLVEASLQATGVEIEGSPSQNVTIAPNSRARVEWTAVVQDVEGVDLTFVAIGTGGIEDAAKPALRTGPNDTIPVYAYTAPDTAGTGGMLREGGAAIETVALPTRYESVSGELAVNINPSLAATTIDALTYLEQYPRACIEQTVSIFLPNVYTLQALRELGVSNPELEANVTAEVDEGLDKLMSAQHVDGSWGWCPEVQQGDPLVTAYAALGLIEAREAGYTIDGTLIDTALNFLRAQFVRPDVNTPSWQLNRQAFFAYVLSRDGNLDRAALQALIDQRLDMSLAARSYLLIAARESFPGDTSLSASLLSDLTSTAVITGTGAHWEELVVDWYNWGSDTRTTALALAAILRADPQNALLPNAVRWLMTARQGDHWTTTQETAWSVMALTDWMLATGELNPNYTYTARLNEETLSEGAITPENVRDTQTLSIDVANLLQDRANRLQIVRGEGEGALYYTAHLDLRLPADDVNALSRGVTVSREYFLNGDPNQPITSAQVGDTVTVRLTITLPQDIHYFTLEDPLPGGLESVNTDLLTSSITVDDPKLRMPTQDDPFWFWGWWWFDRTELRDEQTTLFADFLPRGTYVYTYQTQATVPGEFMTLPATGYAFYQPEVFGRTDGSIFTVEYAEPTE